MHRPPRPLPHEAAHPSIGLPVIIAVTARAAVRLRIAAVSAQLALGRPCFAGTLEEALALDPRGALLVIDLGSCAPDADRREQVRAWARLAPAREIVLFTPLLERDAELRVALELLRALRDLDPHVLTATDFYRDESWPPLVARLEHAALARALRADFMDAVARTGGSLRAESAVLSLLAAAPCGAPRGGDGAMWRESPARDDRRARERERKSHWKLLREAGQMPASCIELVFRVLWFARLRHAGWSTAHIAEFLHYGSAAELRRAIRRRLGVGVRALRYVEYPDTLHWAAAVIVAPPWDERRPTARALGRALLRGVERRGAGCAPSVTGPRAQGAGASASSAVASSRTPRLISRESTAANPS